MKKFPKFTITLTVCFIFIFSCNKDDTIPDEQNITELEIGLNFRQVGHNYEDISPNGVQYVNSTPGVENISNGYTGEHWVYESPSLDGQEIGFSVVYPENYNGDPLDVVLFFHGSNGNENNGASLFFDSFNNSFSSTQKVLIFANGIYAPNTPGSTGVWKLRTIEGHDINHNFQLMELIAGIVESDTLFPFAKKTMQNWSATGFSAGGQITLGLYMDPIFIENPKYQPKNILPLGAWASNFPDYLDFDSGLDLLQECANDIELTLANHVLDNVTCSGNFQYPQRTWLFNRFDPKNIRYTYLGLQDDTPECQPTDTSNPVHSIKFYLRNQISNSIKDITCRDLSYLDNYTLLGNILFGEQ